MLEDGLYPVFNKRLALNHVMYSVDIITTNFSFIDDNGETLAITNIRMVVFIFETSMFEYQRFGKLIHIIIMLSPPVKLCIGTGVSMM